MKTLLLLLLACTLTPSAVFGHGYIVNPEMTWVVNPFYDKNAPAAFYDASSTFGQNPLDIYPNLRHIVAQDTPYTNIPLIAANANKNCGMTSTTGPTRTISGYLKFDVDPSALHEGPCEVWVDDVRTMVARSCKTTYTGRPWNIPVDMTKCTRSTCVVQFIWIGTHNPTYEVFKNCFPVASGTTTSQAQVLKRRLPKHRQHKLQLPHQRHVPTSLRMVVHVVLQTVTNTAPVRNVVASMVTVASALRGVAQTRTQFTTVTVNAQGVVQWPVLRWPPTEAVVAPAMEACTVRAPSAVANMATVEWGHHGATTTPTPSTTEETAPSAFRVLQKYSQLSKHRTSLHLQITFF
ncbi:hypothetical protein F444_12377 [Phytophthora nicotianae P1976]|uniref:Chitin-binding type-4 domain-containing protein n=1 Tax=Phytophthora nicotianae P1976 TaxID=1317066 RepID=A0A080ZX33_PHYNI|nr:hypothetical protein F444_12377 [Phytophthora nicotianae P1976]